MLDNSYLKQHSYLAHLPSILHLGTSEARPRLWVVDDDYSFLVEEDGDGTGMCYIHFVKDFLPPILDRKDRLD